MAGLVRAGAVIAEPLARDAVCGGDPRGEPIVGDPDAAGQAELGDPLEHALAERAAARLRGNLGVEREMRATGADAATGVDHAGQREHRLGERAQASRARAAARR